ncbi:galectin-3 [Elysia marginata]|uniref:Galectin n=1 Tax=Elysia marginata TaxID=1093978 RepID=A0AAV4HXJ9_9GAST|nr:galectin-3 [Elysia marginata]
MKEKAESEAESTSNDSSVEEAANEERGGEAWIEKKRRKDKKINKTNKSDKKDEESTEVETQDVEKDVKKDRKNANEQKGAQDRGRSTNISRGDITRYSDRARKLVVGQIDGDQGVRDSGNVNSNGGQDDDDDDDNDDDDDDNDDDDDDEFFGHNDEGVLGESSRLRRIHQVQCARACLNLEACTAFTFSDGVQGSCSFCPAENITALVFTPADNHTETWVRRYGQFINPVRKQYLPIPGGGSPGRLVVVKGTALVPMPRKISLEFLNEEQGVVVLKFSRYIDRINHIRLNAKIGDTWDQATKRNVPEELFPFAEGEDYEINFLMTSRGFAVYVNDRYLMTYNMTISYAGLIDTIEVRCLQELRHISF